MERASLLEEAVALDTGFAMAWRKIAVLLGNDDRIDNPSPRSAQPTATAGASPRWSGSSPRATTTPRGPPDHDRALAAYEEVIGSTQLDAERSTTPRWCTASSAIERAEGCTARRWRLSELAGRFST